MLNRLNGWQRIGVVLTALWIIYVFALGAISYTNLRDGEPFVKTVKGVGSRCTAYQDPLSAPSQSFESESVLEKTEPNPFDQFDPPQLQRQSADEFLDGCAPGAFVPAVPDEYLFMPWAMLAAAFIPPLLLWLAIYALIGVIRWIAAGFRRSAS